MTDFHATIKLITGEEIFALVSVDNSEDEPVVIMQNIVLVLQELLMEHRHISGC